MCRSVIVDSSYDTHPLNPGGTFLLVLCGLLQLPLSLYGVDSSPDI